MVTTWRKNLMCSAGVLAVLALAATALQAAPPIPFFAIPSPGGSANMKTPGIYLLPASEQTVVTHVSARGVPGDPEGVVCDTVVFTFSVANHSKHTVVADPSVARIEDEDGHEVLGASAFSGATVFNELVIPPGARKFFRLEFSIYPPTSVTGLKAVKLTWPFEYGDQCFLSDFYFNTPSALQPEEPSFREREVPGPESPATSGGWYPARGEGETASPPSTEPDPIYLYPYYGWQVPIYPYYGYLWGYYPGFVTVPWALPPGRFAEQGDLFLARPPRLIDHPIFAVPNRLAPPNRR